MSGYVPCTCKGKNRRKFWKVRMLKCNYSAFESPKYQKHSSEYSQVICTAPGCMGNWRTKSNYVYDLPLGNRR